ncbi:iron complex transport system permease protein [Halorubrum trapanicum]|uniref:Cobalamin import system permease protein BtuC n=1 Tax=Halorubrum trapanicum TaxID=29284 RepID=A0A8J7RDT3_9EURY|nr:iron ABC transporter permease [Halorubrum trapanicum]MBP1902096.1 iron complex transport system permease protein [Halorubrum trapanicum]
MSEVSVRKQVSERFTYDWISPSLVTVVLGSLAVLVVSTLAQVSFGTYQLTLGEAWRTVLDPSVIFSVRAWETFLLGRSLPAEFGRQTLVVWNIRLPRILVGVLVGANLAVSGAIFQAITRNELASPYILGISQGAGLVIIVVLMFFPAMASALPILASIGGAVAFVLVYAIAWKSGASPVRLVLAGVIVGTVFGSVQSGLFFFIDDLATVMSARTWMAGSLIGKDWEQVRLALPFTTLALGLALLISRQLNVLLLGEDTAKSLGMSIEKVRFGASAIGILCASAAISVAGLVGFVGLIVPHMVRNLVGSDYKPLLIGCVFVGPALLVSADVGARLALNPTQLPVGVITGLVGGPYFLYLMRQKTNLGEI